MTRGVGLLALLAALAAAGWLVGAQLRAPASGTTPATATAPDTAASVDLQQAASALESARAFGGSYAGVDVSGFGVRVVRADASAYCIEARGLHVAGPGGAPMTGSC